MISILDNSYILILLSSSPPYWRISMHHPPLVVMFERGIPCRAFFLPKNSPVERISRRSVQIMTQSAPLRGRALSTLIVE